MNYRVLSKYRFELMGIAMLWVMLFHSFDLDLGHVVLQAVRRMGFGGVDIFILLSAMGLPRAELLGNSAAVVLGMVYNFLPYMILPIYTVMSKIEPRYLEAAADLGCNGFDTFRRVVMPLSASGVVSGITI